MLRTQHDADSLTMTSISSIQASTAAAAASPKPAEPPKAAAPAASTSAGPAATLQLSQKALALLKGDKDWQPGATVDNF